MKIKFLHPKVTTKVQDWFDERQGLDIVFSTELIYREFDVDTPSYLGIRILGFGIAITWHLPPEY